MSKATTLRRMLLAPPTLRTCFLPASPRVNHPILCKQYGTAPSVISTSFWRNMIPKSLRKSTPSEALKKKAKSKEWNPATFFIIIFLFIGSMSIQMITLRIEFEATTRRADAKIGLLKEIIERIQNGEDVDVEGLLGTGDAAREQEWEEVLQDIEREDKAWEQSQKTKPKHGRNVEEAKATPNPEVKTATIATEFAKENPKSKAPAGFY